MTLEEFQQKTEIINKDRDKKWLDLCKDYAFTNNPYKVGDILEDHYQIIKIESIKLSITRESACCIYIGPQLRMKTLEPYKNGAKSTMYQLNVKQKIK